MTEALTLEQQKANRKLWVEALRSGKYEQGTGQLANGDGGFCCLGVLAICAGYPEAKLQGIGTLDKFQGAMDFVGLCNPAGQYVSDSLADRNDKGVSFK